jgi:hypothetical protein
MVGWTCPECDRQFGRRGQSHTCVPAMSLDEYFETAQPWEKPIFDAVHAHLASLEPLRVEALTVGIVFKRARTFAELRPMRARMRLWMLRSTPLTSPRIARTERVTANRVACCLDLRDPSEVDEELRDWLTEAYVASTV